MQTRTLSVGKKTAESVEIPLPHAPMVLVIGSRGYLMCGYLDLATAEKMGDCAAVIRGVKNSDELLAGTISGLTSKAKEAGLALGMTGSEALKLLV